MSEIEDVSKKFKTINVEIQGVTSLLMNNIENAELSSSDTIKSTTKKKIYNNEEEAEKSAYWLEDQTGRMLYVPARCVYAMILNSAKSFKVGQKSLSNIMAGTIRVEPEKISLGTDQYAVDVQAVVVQGSNRVKRARARVDKWKLAFNIVYHEDYIQPDAIQKSLSDAGFKVGLLDFRPQKRGPYGTFIITKFVVIP